MVSLSGGNSRWSWRRGSRGLSIGLRQQRYWVNDSQVQTFIARAINQLQQAAWICGGHNLRTGGLDVLDFPLQKLAGHLRLNQIVNPSAPAAPGAFGQLHKF